MNLFKLSISMVLLTVTSLFAASDTVTDANGDTVSNSGGCVLRNLSIAGVGNVQYVRLKLDIEHSKRSDLRILLRSPDGTTVGVVDDVGGSNDNLIVDFDDRYGTNVSAYDQNIPNKRDEFIPLSPQESFSAFDGETGTGTWQLDICDDVGGSSEADTGTYYKAILTVSDQPAPALLGKIADDFESNLYANSSGNVPWEGPWVEFGDSSDAPFSDPDTGDIQLTSGYLEFKDLSNGTKSIVRAANLEGKINVRLKFDIPTNALGSEKLQMQLWNTVLNDWTDIRLIGSSSGSSANMAIPDTRTDLLNRDAKVRFISGSGAWTSGTNIRLDNLRFEFDYKDTDRDGVGDISDLDDDNDGILDAVENSEEIKGIFATRTWSKESDSSATSNLGNGIVRFSGDMKALDDPPVAALNAEGKNASHPDFWSPESEASLKAFPALSFTSNAAFDPNPRFITITLPEPTNKVLLHLDRLGASDGTASTSAKFTLQNTTGFTVSMANSNGNLELNGFAFNRILGIGGQTQTDSTGGTSDTDASAAGTIIFSNTTAFSELKFQTQLFKSNGDEDLYFGEDGVYLVVETQATLNGSKDSDGDGISDQYDLDSDNDGIPDSIEAQATVTPLYIQGIGNVDAIHGVPNEVGLSGLTPIHTDSDGVPDFLDADSDGDDIADCIEGNVNIGPNGNCPITTVLADGMSADAGSDGNYSNIYGNVDDTITKLVGYDASVPEVAYRIANVCGTPEWNFTAMQWKTISISCAVTQGIDTIFASLGTYGDSGDWMMYKQVSDFSGTSASMVELASGEVLVPGKGYWMITDGDKDASSVLNNNALTKTKTARQLYVNHSVEHNASFTEVNTYTALPDGKADVQKVILGNPFPRAFHLGLMFFSYDTGATYYPMSDGTSVSPFAHQTVYTHDNNSIGYTAKTPAGTPGFGDSIAPGQGFWLRLEAAAGSSNQVDYPFEK